MNLRECGSVVVGTNPGECGSSVVSCVTVSGVARAGGTKLEGMKGRARALRISGLWVVVKLLMLSIWCVSVCNVFSLTLTR